MDTELAASSLNYLLSPWPLGLLFLGTLSGVLVGAIPGLTGAMLITLTLPLTFQMQYAGGDLDAMILLTAMYVGSISGGLISATLLKMPGTPASMMTTLDGYPMAQGGQPERALGLGISASFVGGVISWLFLLLLARPMALWSTRLGPFEIFSLVLMALILIASVSGKNLALGLASGLAGMLASMPGTHPATGNVRLTGGWHALDAGLPLLPVLIGLFAVSQILIAAGLPVSEKHVERIRGYRGVFMTSREWLRSAINLVRSSLIGTWIGILPGIGANIGSAVAYGMARSFSRTPDRFGTGSEEGIIASEAANNATVGGALIPLVSLGIPGSVIDAILLGALVIHGLQPGPLLFKTHPEVVHGIIWSFLISNIWMLLIMVVGIPLLARVILIPRQFLLPLVLLFCVVGSFALNHRFFDVWVMLGFGALGVGMERYSIPTAPFVIGFVLAPLAEENLCAGLMQSGGSYLPLITSPVSSLFLVVGAVLLAWSLVQRKRAAPA